MRGARVEPTMTELWTIHESPIGPLTLRGAPGGLRGLDFPGRDGALDPMLHAPDAFADARRQLEEYFAGERRAFDLPLDLQGTPFQLAVWERLREIPYGSTISYLQLAVSLGRRDRVRAAGSAVGRTPVPIVVPCHRVLGSDGSLTGYGGGLDRKRALLDLEQGRLSLV
jgi:methylated-DNA-[protein]-cysteine S-methyltransferase